MRHDTILKNAAILTACFLSFTLLQWGLGTVYFKEKSLLSSAILRIVTALLVTLIALAVGIVSIQKIKRRSGFITLKNAFAALFLPILIALILNGIFKVVLFNYIDPDYIELNRKFAIESMMKARDAYAKARGESDFNAQLERIKATNPYSVPTVVRSITTSLFGYLILSLITVFSIKKAKTIPESQ